MRVYSKNMPHLFSLSEWELECVAIMQQFSFPGYDMVSTIAKSYALHCLLHCSGRYGTAISIFFQRYRDECFVSKYTWKGLNHILKVSLWERDLYWNDDWFFSAGTIKVSVFLCVCVFFFNRFFFLSKWNNENNSEFLTL